MKYYSFSNTISTNGRKRTNQTPYILSHSFPEGSFRVVSEGSQDGRTVKVIEPIPLTPEQDHLEGLFEGLRERSNEFCKNPQITPEEQRDTERMIHQDELRREALNTALRSVLYMPLDATRRRHIREENMRKRSRLLARRKPYRG